MKSSFSPNINKIKIKNLNINLNPSSPLSLKKHSQLFILPPLDSESKRQVLNKPTSLLTKFIHDRTRNLIKSTKEALKKPVKLNKKKLTDLNIIKVSNMKKQNTNNFFITDNVNNKESELNSKNEENNNDNYNNDFPILDLNSNNNRRKLNLNNIDNISSLTIDHKIRENQMKILFPKFRRTRMYQPIISENWKFRSGLRITIGNEKGNSLALKNDVEYQYKVIDDEYKLLEDNYMYYKSRVTSKEYYFDSFRSMSLVSKIKYNKALEETIGILYILPQLLLVEFYKLIKNYSSVEIPNPDLFKEKYVFDEVKNLKYNNALLAKVFEFFKSCYEVYGTLIKEVNDMYLKPNGFLNVINCLEKSRYNLSYVSTSSENGFKNYFHDLKYMQQLSNDKGASQSIDLTLKIRNQFGFKKNEEKQRKIRIETALYNKKDQEEYNDDDSDKKDNKKNKVFNSFVESKLINGIMKHLTKEAKNQITTQKINYEINGNYDDDDENVKKKHKVVRINL